MIKLFLWSKRPLPKFVTFVIGNYCAFSVTALLHKIRFAWLVLFHAHSLFVSSSLPQYFYIMQLKRDEFEENYKQDRSEVPAQ